MDDDNLTLTISDEGLNNENFVEIFLKDEEIILGVDELMSALIAFNVKRSKQEDREASFNNN